MVYSSLIMIRRNTAGFLNGATPLVLPQIALLLLFDSFKGYLLYSVDKHVGKASNSAGQNPAPPKSNIGEDEITTFQTGDGRQHQK